RRRTRSKRDWSSDVCSSDLGAVSVHMVNGIWGALAVGLFSNGGDGVGVGLFYGGGFRQLGIQVLGAVSVAAYVLVVMFIVFKVKIGSASWRGRPGERVGVER